MREKSKTILVSHKLKFVFIHNYKVAGTSIRKALCPYESNLYWLISNFLFQIPGTKRKTKLTLPKHADLKQVEKYYNLNKYFTFGLVRNPWDWEVSKYFYMKQTPKHFQHNLAKSFSDFNDYLEWRATDYKNQIEFFKNEDGKIAVNFICKIEELNELEKMFKNKFDLRITLPKLNKSKRQNYKKYYDKKSIQLVEDIHKPDIDEFNYSF